MRVSHPSASETRRSGPPWLLWLLPGVLAAVLYLPALDDPLVWDDAIVLEDQLPAFRSIADVFSPPPQIPQWPSSYYRPVLTASYLLDRALFGSGDAAGHHGMGILFHALSTILATVLATQALRGFRFQSWGSLAAGSLFAAHPIHTEAVCWISGRSDPLAAIFLFAALALSIRFRDQRSTWALVLSPLLFLLGALTKEVALAGLVLMPLWLTLVPRDSSTPEKATSGWRSASPLLILYAVAAAIYSVLRAVGTSGEGPLWLVLGPGEAAGRILSALAWYLRKLVMPLPQSVLVTTLPGTLATLGVLILVAAAAVWGWRRTRRASEPRSLGELAAAWIFIPLVPALPVAISRLAEAPVAERYLYLPSLGLCLGFGALVAWGMTHSAWRRPVAVLSVGILAAAAAGTLYRGKLWSSEVALWSDAVRKAPEAGLAWGELGKAWLDRGENLDQALEYFQKAIDQKNDAFGRARAYNSMGVIHARRGRMSEAAAAWRAALGERDDDAQAHYNLANLLAGRVEAEAREGRLAFARLDELKTHLHRAVELDPRYLKAWLRLVWADALKARYLAAAGDQSAAGQALAEARRSRDRLAAVDREGALTAEADRLLTP